jgi:hypothetical protein
MGGKNRPYVPVEVNLLILARDGAARRKRGQANGADRETGEQAPPTELRVEKLHATILTMTQGDGYVVPHRSTPSVERMLPRPPEGHLPFFRLGKEIVGNGE